MNEWMLYLLVAATAAVVAGVAGYLLGRSGSAAGKAGARAKELQHELNAQRDEQLRYREAVNDHFQKSADLFNQLSSTYRSLYEHLAEGSDRLAASALPGELGNAPKLEPPGSAAAAEDREESPAIDRDEHLARMQRALAGAPPRNKAAAGGNGQHPPSG